ncbi:MAG: hypothetical protein JNJ60_17310 [Rhodocyclaceae bacterium]|nr:hypothetical protein [Rhodocyclaceae bacterium]
MRGLGAGVAVALLAGAAQADLQGTAAGARVWDFAVTLDGKPIGRHRYSLTPADAAGTRVLSSEADYLVKFLGIPVFRYRHEARERWEGNCLAGLVSSTDQDGRRSRVLAEPAGNGLRIAVDTPAGGAPAEPQLAAGCVMSFAYWNGAMRAQSRLLNPQTGQIETVHIAPAGSAQVDVRGTPVRAQTWRITGAASPVDVWYAEDGEWVGLDALVQGQRKLSYRLQ